MPINNDEQRSFYRMSVDCHIEFTMQGNSDKYEGEGRNLSATGVNFITEKKLMLGQVLDVIIHPVIKTMAPLNAKAEVVRVTEDETNRLYLVAISLKEVG